MHKPLKMLHITLHTHYDEAALPVDMSALEVKRTFGSYIFCINYITISVLPDEDQKQFVLVVCLL